MFEGCEHPVQDINFLFLRTLYEWIAATNCFTSSMLDFVVKLLMLVFFHYFHLCLQCTKVAHPFEPI